MFPDFIGVRVFGPQKSPLHFGWFLVGLGCEGAGHGGVGGLFRPGCRRRAGGFPFRSHRQDDVHGVDGRKFGEELVWRGAKARFLHPQGDPAHDLQTLRPESSCATCSHPTRSSSSRPGALQAARWCAGADPWACVLIPRCTTSSRDRFSSVWSA